MTFEQRQAVFPQHFSIDPDKPNQAVYVSLDKGVFATHDMAESFKRIDAVYTADKLARLQFMADSVIELDAHGLDLSYVHDERVAESTDLRVVFSPLNDGKPESSAQAIHKFVTLEDPSKAEVNEAMPNSWSPATKLDIDYEFGHAENLGMARLQIYARDTPVLTVEERKLVAAGDTRPFGRLLRLGVQEASRRKKEIYGTGEYERVHIFCAGMASKALGAAVEALQEGADFDIASVTAMNLSIGKKRRTNPLRTLGNYMTRRQVGEAAELILPPGYARVAEPLMRREIDGHGAEGAMRTRQAKAILGNPWAVNGIMHSSETPSYIKYLLEKDKTVTVANAFNESIVEQTKAYLPMDAANFHYTSIVGVEGKKVGMMSNEQSAAVAVISNLGLLNYLKSEAR